MAGRQKTMSSKTTPEGSSATTTQERGEPTTATAPFEQAYYDYLNSVAAIVSDPQLRDPVTEAWRDLLRTYYDDQLPLDVWEGLREAQQKVADAFTSGASFADQWTAASEANETSSKMLEKAMTDRSERITAAHAYFVSALEKAPQTVASTAADAIGKYLAAMRDAWAAADISSMTASELEAIGQSLVQVGAVHASLTTPTTA